MQDVNLRRNEKALQLPFQSSFGGIFHDQPKVIPRNSDSLSSLSSGISNQLCSWKKKTFEMKSNFEPNQPLGRCFFHAHSYES